MLNYANVARWRYEAWRILKLAESYDSLEHEELMRRVRELHWQVRSTGPQRHQLADVYALSIELSRRTLGMQHFPVQIMGGIAMFEGNIAEMQTGEGKTLTATLPAIFRAMAGNGTHVITSNDYLSTRDAEKMEPLYSILGLTVGCVYKDMEDDQRRLAYSCDITYGTATEMGFDFLRDRLKLGAQPETPVQRAIFDNLSAHEAPVQRGHYFALIDEADCILIDEARTPLIIGVMEPNREAMISLYRWCSQAIQSLKPDRDFLFDVKQRQADLTEDGCRRVNLLTKPSLMDSIDIETIYQQVEKALTAHLAFERDRDYVIYGDEVVIVDEGSGRMMEGRKWQAGLHQSIEAKERVAITDNTGSAAQMTIQSLYANYQHLAGMTGTAMQAKSEFRRVYGLRVCVIPTNRRCLRQGFPTRVFVDAKSKQAAIVKEIHHLAAKQRAILIGTPSVESSESIGKSLDDAEIFHTVLNAHIPDQEAAIIAEAGTPGTVTIATNMAGRGTDILLNDIVREAGGLHVIATEMHSSKRIDRQLVGRSARQGDPGSFQFLLSLEDELLRVMPLKKRQALIRRASRQANKDGELPAGWVKVFQRVQSAIEKLNLKQRKQLLKQEHEQQKRYRRIGLDPFLEIAED